MLIRMNAATDEIEDRRTSSRVAFGAVLSVAEYHGTLPPPDQMRPVQALDLSHTGIAFSTTVWPTSDWLVILLGEPRKPRYASAHIVGCASKLTERGEKHFEVRCEFERWL